MRRVMLPSASRGGGDGDAIGGGVGEGRRSKAEAVPKKPKLKQFVMQCQRLSGLRFAVKITQPNQEAGQIIIKTVHCQLFSCRASHLSFARPMAHKQKPQLES